MHGMAKKEQTLPFGFQSDVRHENLYSNQSQQLKELVIIS